MAEKVIKSLSEDFVHCTICTEPFNEPKVLPCLHSFCLQCLEKWASNSNDQPSSCPTCRCAIDIPSSGVGGLPNNFFLVSLKERLEEVSRISKQNPHHNCNVCKRKDDILFCLDCKMLISNDCKETHDRFTRSNDHPLVPSDKLSDESYLQRVMSTQAPYCNLHNQEKVRYYCTECSQLACQVCATVHHQGHHSLQEVKTRVKSVKSKLEDLLEQSSTGLKTVSDKLRQKVKISDEIKGQISELHRKIDDRYEELVAKLQFDRQQLQTKLKKIENEKYAKLNDSGQTISNWLRTIENFQKMTRTILQQENPWEILEMEKRIVESFERLQSDINQVTNVSLPKAVHVDFLPTVVSALNKNVSND